MLDLANMGLEMIREETDDFSFSFRPSEEHLNINGTVHGGILFLVCDEAIGRYVTEKGKIGAAADSEIHFYRPAFAGVKYTVTVSERKTGRRLGNYLVEIRDGSGKLTADMMFAVMFNDKM